MAPPREEKPKIEEVRSGEGSSSDDEAPELEGEGAGQGDDGQGGARSKQNRAEKKSRKAVQKLGMKSVPGIVQVRIKKNKAVTFVINNPDVFKSPATDTYIIFGEAKIEERSPLTQNAAVNAALAASQGADAKAAQPRPAARIEEVEDDDGPVDEKDLCQADVELVMTQVNCSRSKAVKALHQNNNDVLEAIMGLTRGD